MDIRITKSSLSVKSSGIDVSADLEATQTKSLASLIEQHEKNQTEEEQDEEQAGD